MRIERARFSHTPRKRFGQNFLQDPIIIEKIISHIHLKNTDRVIEVGPGLGALTKPLLDSVDHLDVIEIDRDLATHLKETFHSPKLTIHQQDALCFDLDSFNKQHPSPKKFRLIGNLPYNISTPLMFHFLKFSTLIEDMHFMLQKEVVARMAAAPHQKDYGRLSIMSQYHCKIIPLFIVDNSAFYPKPKVQSTFVRLIPHQTISFPTSNLALFQAITRTAFNQRRKTLANALKPHLSAQDFIILNINPTLRPEALPIVDFIRITNFINQRSTDPIEHKHS